MSKERLVGEKLLECWGVATLGHDIQNKIPKSAVLNPSSSKWERGVAFFKIVNGLSSKINSLIGSTLLSSSELPFLLHSPCWSYVANGQEQIILKMSSGNSEDDDGFVLKLNARSVIEANFDVCGAASKLKKEYMEVNDMYKGVQVDVPQQSFLVLNIKNPVVDKPVLAVVEKYDRSERIDIFSNCAEEVVALNGNLRTSLSEFATRFMSIWRRENRFIDIIGENNVSFRKFPGQKVCADRVIIGDPHIIYSRQTLQKLQQVNSTLYIKTLDKFKRLEQFSKW